MNNLNNVLHLEQNRQTKELEFRSSLQVQASMEKFIVDQSYCGV